MRTRRTIAALALPLALTGLSACGGDDGDSAVEPASGEATTSGAPTEQPTETSEPSEAPSPTEPTQPTQPAGPDPADLPACAEVWQDEATLPGGYAGCAEGGEAVVPEKRGCAFGRPLITYADRFWAVPTGTVHEADGPLERDRSYQSDLASCTG